MQEGLGLVGDQRSEGLVIERAEQLLFKPLKGKSHQINSMIQTSANVGMVTMDQCLRDLYTRGMITLDDAMARAMNPEELKKMIAGPAAGPGAPGARPV